MPKQFFWESQTDLETLQKVSFHIGVTYKLVLESWHSQLTLMTGFLNFLDVEHLSVEYSTGNNVIYYLWLVIHSYIVNSFIVKSYCKLALSHL